MRNVLRLKPPHTIVIFDGSGFDFFASIEKFEKDAVMLKIVKKEKNIVDLSRETYLFVSLVKKDKFEWIVEKATELGVSHIIPIVSARTEKKDINSMRLKTIIKEAAEQSGRGKLPILAEVLGLEKALANYSSHGKIALEPLAPRFLAGDFSSVDGIFVGPEGGWTGEEIEMFKKYGVMTRSLGSQILRTETAVVAGLSQIVF